MPDFDTFEMLGQWLTAGANAWCAGFGFRCGSGQFGFNGRQILGHVVFEQTLLLRRERFALYAETNTLEVGQFESELLDLEVFGVEFHLVCGGLIYQALNLCQEGWVRGQFGKFGEQIHGWNYTMGTHQTLAKQGFVPIQSGLPTRYG